MKETLFVAGIMLFSTVALASDNTAPIPNSAVIEMCESRVSSDQGEWIGSKGISSLPIEEWITYYDGSPAWYTWAGPERSTRFDPPDFPNSAYPFWIKRVRNTFYEDGAAPWNGDQFRFVIYGNTGADTLYESPLMTALKYPLMTELDLGVDSVEITSGNFYVSVRPADTVNLSPDCLADGSTQGQSFFGSPGSWSGWTNGEFTKEAYVSWFQSNLDVSAFDITDPGTGVWVDTSYTVSGQVRNNGNSTQTFDVEFLIKDSGSSTVYAETVNVANLAPAASRQVNYSNWMPALYGENYSMSLTTLLSGDQNPGNDTFPATTESYEFGEIAWDDFSPDGFWVVNNPNGAQDAFAIRLSPYLPTPFVVTKFKIYVNSSEAFDNVRLVPDMGGVPDFTNPYDAITGPLNSSPPGWIIENFDTTMTSISSPNPLWLVAQFASGQSGPGIANDSSNSNFNSYWTSDLSGWNLSTSGNWQMRIVHSTSVGVEENEVSPNTIPHLVLHQTRPNPITSSAEILYQVPVKGEVSLTVYDISGSLVKTLASGIVDAGEHRVTWDGKDARGKETSSGLYFYRLIAGDLTSTRKLVLLR
jgi:hypothetical protein